MFGIYENSNYYLVINDLKIHQEGSFIFDTENKEIQFVNIDNKIQLNRWFSNDQKLIIEFWKTSLKVDIYEGIITSAEYLSDLKRVKYTIKLK